MRDAEIENYSRRISEYKENISELQTNLQARDNCVEKLEKEKSNVQNEQIRQERVLQKMCKQVNKFTESNANLKSKLREMDNKVIELKDKISQKENEIEKLVESDKKTREYLINQQKAYSSKKSEFNLEVEKLNQKIASQDRVVRDLKAKYTMMIDEYEAKCGSLEEENGRIKNKFEENFRSLKSMKISMTENVSMLEGTKQVLLEKERLIKLQNDLIEKRGAEIKILIARQNQLVKNSQ